MSVSSLPHAFAHISGSHYNPETSLSSADRETRAAKSGKMGGFITEDPKTFVQYMSSTAADPATDTQSHTEASAKASSAAAVAGAKTLRRGWFSWSSKAEEHNAEPETLTPPERGYGDYSDVAKYRFWQKRVEADNTNPAYYNPSGDHVFSRNMNWLSDAYHRRMIHKHFPARSDDDIDRKYSLLGARSFNEAVMHYGGLSVNRFAPPKTASELEQFRLSLGNASADCNAQLGSFETCLSENEHNSDCLNAWDTFLACSENHRM